MRVCLSFVLPLLDWKKVVRFALTNRKDAAMRAVDTSYRSLHRLAHSLVLVAGLVLLLTLFSTPQAAQAESYVAGQLGYTLQTDLSSGHTMTPGFSSLALSDIALKDAMLYGGKIGHYFAHAPWLGLELDIYNSTPHLKGQDTTFTGPGGSTTIPLPGAYQRVLTIAPTLMLRYPGKRLQPYLGIGPGVFLGRIKDSVTGDSQSSTRVGLHALLGVNYFLTPHVAVFTEGKIDYAKFSYGDEANLFGFTATYLAQHITFGVGYHF